MSGRILDIQHRVDDPVFEGAVFKAQNMLPHRMTSTAEQLFVEIDAGDFADPTMRETAIILVAAVPGLSTAVIDRLTAEALQLDGTTGLHLYLRRAPGTPSEQPDPEGNAARLRALIPPS